MTAPPFRLDDMHAPTRSSSHRALFLSDVHLGTRGCQAELLLDFLDHHDAATIYLVGDIIDGWRLRKNWYWPQSHNDVVQKLLQKARGGSRVIYLPGNHDEFLRDYLGTHFGGVEVMESVVHRTADGTKLLVIHGDQFDVVVRHARWLAALGDWAYVTTLAANTVLNRIRRRLGLTYWSLSAWAKHRVKKAVNFIGSFEETLSSEAARRGVDGVVCGHIHHPAIREVAGVRYVNTGDWVESCSAVVETEDGTLRLVNWTGAGRSRALTHGPLDAKALA